jgi:transcriptional regulator EpsA
MTLELVNDRRHSDRRHSEFLDVIRSSLEVNSTETFCEWVQCSLKNLFPHESLICGIGLIEEHSAFVQNVISCNFPSEYLHLLQQSGGLTTSPVFCQWVKTKRPVLFEASTQNVQSEWLKNFNLYNLNNMAAHGLREIGSYTTSYFCFSKIPTRLTSQHSDMLEMLIPYLHVTLMRALNGEQVSKKDISQVILKKQLLTARQKEILILFSQGLTYKQIAEKLQVRSHKTIEQHLDSVRLKLSVKTRRECIQKAVNLGLL